MKPPKWHAVIPAVIDDQGFPVGIMLSANIRAWPVDEVRQWLATRPTERKVVPPPRNRSRAAAAIEKHERGLRALGIVPEK